MLQSIHRYLEEIEILGLDQVRFLWIPAHRDIVVSQRSNKFAKLATEFQVKKNSKIVFDDFKEIIKRDFDSWASLCWPYGFIEASSNPYSRYIIVKNRRPWFTEVQLRSELTLINRLRSFRDLIYNPQGKGLFEIDQFFKQVKIII